MKTACLPRAPRESSKNVERFDAMATYTVVQVCLGGDFNAKVRVPTSGKLLAELRLDPDDPLERLLDLIRGGADNMGFGGSSTWCLGAAEPSQGCFRLSHHYRHRSFPQVPC